MLKYYDGVFYRKVTIRRAIAARLRTAMIRNIKYVLFADMAPYVECQGKLYYSGNGKIRDSYY